MSEEKAATTVALSDAVISPPNYGVSQVTIGASIAEFVITVGHTRQLVDKTTGYLTPSPAIEWLSSLSMSPVVAQQLYDGLTVALKQYRAQFGKIPRDPSSMKDIAIGD
jgi:hypothetical protein